MVQQTNFVAMSWECKTRQSIRTRTSDTSCKLFGPAVVSLRKSEMLCVPLLVLFDLVDGQVVDIALRKARMEL